jgi:hypothetical protein
MRSVLTAAAGACRWGVVMFDSPTWNLVQELSSAREFTVTEDHLKLLRCAYVAWGLGEGYGAPGIDPKKP